MTDQTQPVPRQPYDQPVPRSPQPGPGPQQGRRRPAAPQKTPRSIVTLAVLGLIAVGCGSVAGMVYDTVFNGASTAPLISIASIAVGALASIAGGVAVAANKRNDGP